MSVARITTLSSNSKTSFDAAIKEGIERANKTLRGVTGAWVKEQKVEIAAGSFRLPLVLQRAVREIDEAEPRPDRRNRFGEGSTRGNHRVEQWQRNGCTRSLEHSPP